VLAFAPRLRRLILLAAGGLVLVAAIVVVLAVAPGGGDEQHVRVQALWYGMTEDGRTVGGVTPVDITAVEDDPQTPLSVDVRGLQASGAGPMWTAATSVAGVQAVLISGVDPRDRQLRYALREAIDGPSAGALLSTGSLAALRGVKISRSTTMTGTVLPDGSVGRVSGLGEKVRAAAKAGFTRVLVPTGLRQSPGEQGDLARLGRSVGVQVTPVKSVPDAYALMTGQTVRVSARPRPPIKAGILRMLDRRSRALIVTANRQAKELLRTPGRKSRSQASDITALVGRAEQALAGGDPVLAFAAASEGAQRGRQAVASARLDAAAARTPLPALTDQVRHEAERSLREIRAQVRRTAETPVTKVAQLTALADTLSWGDFALTSITVAQRRLRRVRTKAELDEIVQFMEVARFEAATYMTACAESLQYLGTKRMTDDTVDLLNAYTELIGYAADANRAYANSLGLATSDRSYLGQLLAESDGLTRAVSPAFRGLRGPTATPALRMSVALLEYVESTQVVNDLTYRDPEGNDGPPNLARIKDQTTVHTQALNADEIVNRRIRDIAAAGLDPSFVQWNSRWGADLAFRRLPNTTGEQRLHGLQYQWFAVLQARLLTALS
jgi:Lon protease (S16) C-terminal proteolytic domain